jgi:NAD(P)H-dependent flavin oxidoreductase YrpB (nitropropane dioxygenase family)
MRTELTHLLGIEAPIVQGSFGPWTSVGLSAAISDAGGLGSLGTAMVPPERVGRMIAEMRERTDRPFAVNHTWRPLNEESVRITLEARPPVISLALGGPGDLAGRAHDAGAKLMAQVHTVEQAVRSAEAGADIVIAQGAEAGGFGGEVSTMALVPQVVDAVAPVPVLAAGGIADGRGLADVLAAGAAGARVGTRLVATPESGAHPDYVAAVLAARSGSTEITDAFAVCPLCATRPTARVLSSAVAAVRALPEGQVGVLSTPNGEMALTRGHGMPPSRTVTGTVAAMALYAGEAVGAVSDVRPAGDVVAAMCRGADALLIGAVPQPREPGGRER